MTRLNIHDITTFLQAWREWGKMHKMGAKNNKGMEHHEKKKPSKHEMAKWEKKGKKQPKMHKVEGELQGNMEEDDDEQGTVEIEGGLGMVEGEDAHDDQVYEVEVPQTNEHVYIQADDHGDSVVSQEELMMADLAQAGYTIDSHGDIVPIFGHFY